MQTIRALDYDFIYGDSYTITESALENIGNNVSIVFKDMNFGDTSVCKLTIEGCSPIDINKIHVQISKEDKDIKQIIEFTYSEQYEKRTFHIDPLTGECEITLVFLPGSKFHLKSLQFHI